MTDTHLLCHILTDTARTLERGRIPNVPGTLSRLTDWLEAASWAAHYLEDPADDGLAQRVIDATIALSRVARAFGRIEELRRRDSARLQFEIWATRAHIENARLAVLRAHYSYTRRCY